MSDTATKNVPDYLREARLKAGYASRGTATTKVPYGIEISPKATKKETAMEIIKAILQGKTAEA